MSAPRPQQTINEPAAVHGRGYWTGAEVTVEFRPSPPETGIYFTRDDLAQSGSAAPRIPAHVASQSPADRRTILTAGDSRVEMVEHVLAALFGLGIDNCEVGVTGPEMPGCDGSAQAFVEAIAFAGIRQQEAASRPLVVREPVRCTNGEQWIEARPPMGDVLSIEYSLDYGTSSIPPQWYVADITPAAFRHELAPARTFLLEEEAEAIRARGLASHVTAQDLLIFGPDGPIDNQLRFEDECARHKALDVVGDLALAGRPIVGHIVACRSGHRMNADLVRQLLASHSDDQTTRRSA